MENCRTQFKRGIHLDLICLSSIMGISFNGFCSSRNFLASFQTGMQTYHTKF